MIYISSSCVKRNRIADSVKYLADNGFKNIELSGGTEYYNGWEEELLKLKKKYDLNYLLHNYFPPPKEHFVLNLASENSGVYKRSTAHILNAISLCSKFQAGMYGFHAGYLIDPEINELGKKFSRTDILNRESAINRFCNGFDNIIMQKGSDVELYIENNVVSYSNFKTFGINPFMLTSSKDCFELQKRLNFKLLLDVAHLKVSSNTLRIDFEKELSLLIPFTDYIHISDNDGFHDQNSGLSENNDLIDILKQYNFSKKTITIEVYEDIEVLKQSYIKVRSLL